MAGWAAAGQILGSLLGAGGQIAAGQTGQASNSQADVIATQFNPGTIPSFFGSQQDALSLLGRQDETLAASPAEQLVSRIMAMPIDNKLKRRALHAIANIRERGAQGIEDPAFRRNVVEEFGDDAGITETVPFAQELRGVLARLGLTEDEFVGTLNRDAAFKQRQAELQEQIEPIQRDTILNRARAAAAASQLIGDASGFALSGEPQSGAQSDILNRINRGIDDQEEAFLLRSRFGGFQPGAGLEALSRARTDAPMTAVEQALAQAAGLTATLGGGLELNQTAAGQAIGSAQGAAGIAAQQAQAANALRNQANIFNANQTAQGIAGGAGSLGSGISNAILISQLYGNNSGGTAPGSGTNAFYRPNLNPYDVNFRTQTG